MRLHAVRSSAFALGLILSAAAPAVAQSVPSAPATIQAGTAGAIDTPELVTDRPDFTESSQVIPRRWFQLESGLSYEGEGQDLRSFAAPSTLMRIGLGRHTELRLGADGVLSESFGGVRVSGTSDVEIGTKTQVLFQDRSGIDLAFLPMVSLPTGADGFSSDGVDPTLKITWGRDLAAGFGLTGNVNVSSLSTEAGRFHQEAFSVSLGHDLVAGWSGYAEAYGFSRLGPGEAAAWTFNGGITRPVGAQFQFDLEAGRGLTSAAPDWFVGVGFAVLSPFGRR